MNKIEIRELYSETGIVFNLTDNLKDLIIKSIDDKIFTILSFEDISITIHFIIEFKKFKNSLNIDLFNKYIEIQKLNKIYKKMFERKEY